MTGRLESDPSASSALLGRNRTKSVTYVLGIKCYPMSRFAHRSVYLFSPNLCKAVHRYCWPGTVVRPSWTVAPSQPKCGLPTSRRRHQEMNFERRWKPGSIKSGLSAAGGNFYGVAGTDAFSVLARHVFKLDGRVMDVEAFP